MNFKVPFIVRTLFGFIALFLISYNVFYRIYKESKNKEKFFHNQISSKIYNSNSYHGRSLEFHLENGPTIYFMPPINDKIIIGDSIRKEKNTYRYNIYRRDNNGVYKYFTTYNFEDIQ